MGRWKRVALVAMALAMVAGCGSGGANTAQTASTSSPGQTVSAGPAPSSVTVAPFDAMVALSDYSATCREVTCWLPTQFDTKLVKGETVSLRDQWPMDGMKVRVLCETTGETYRDQTGHDTNAWYGIAIPNDKLEPGAGARAKKAPDGSVIGFVGVAWINGGSGKQAPAC